MGKDNPIAAFAPVCIAGKHCAAVWIRFGNHVHQIGVPPLTEHQFPVAGQRQLTRALRMIAQLDHHKFHRCVHGNVGK